MDADSNGNKGTKGRKPTKVKLNSAAYLRQKEKAYQRKQKYLQNLTEEQKELKRAKDREYYRKKMAESKRKSIRDMTETERGKQRTIWKENSKKYRQKKKSLRKTACKTKKEENDIEKSVIEESSTSAVDTMKNRPASENGNDTTTAGSSTDGCSTDGCSTAGPSTDGSSTAGSSNDNQTSVLIKQELQDADYSEPVTTEERIGHIEIKIEPLDDDVDVKTEQDPLTVQEYGVTVKNEFDGTIMIKENHELALSNVKKET